MEIQTHIDIDAAPEQVWSVLTDFERHAAWNPFIREIRGEAREGAQLYIRLQPPHGQTMTLKPVVSSVAPPRTFAWRGSLLSPGLLKSTHAFHLEPLETGHTRFHHHESFDGLLVPFVKRSLDTDTRRGFELMNEALQVEVENVAT